MVFADRIDLTVREEAFPESCFCSAGILSADGNLAVIMIFHIFPHRNPQLVCFSLSQRFVGEELLPGAYCNVIFIPFNSSDSSVFIIVGPHPGPVPPIIIIDFRFYNIGFREIRDPFSDLFAHVILSLLL